MEEFEALFVDLQRLRVVAVAAHRDDGVDHVGKEGQENQALDFEHLAGAGDDGLFVDGVDEIEGRQDLGEEKEHQSEGDVEGVEYRLQAVGGAGPVGEVVLVHDEMPTGKEGPQGDPDEDDPQRAVDEEEKLVSAFPEDIVGLFAVFVGDSLDDEAEEDRHPDIVGPAEADGVEEGEGRKKRPAEHHQRGEGQLPFAPQGIDDEVTLGFRFPQAPEQGLPALDEGHEDKESPQKRNEEPPILLQGQVGKFFKHLSAPWVRF